jgi:uncharacterized iron-regulated protein
VKKLYLISLSVLFGSALLLGCVRTASAPAWVSAISAEPGPPGPELIYALPEGQKRSFQELLTSLDGAQVIFVGEIHDQVEHHRIQLRVLQELLRKEKDVVVGMEMFERSQQPILDRWSQDLLTEGEFRKEVGWESRWGMDYGLYRGILDEIRSHRLKFLGLNVDRELVRKVAQGGIEGLSPEERRTLPEMDLTNQEHRAYIASVYKHHEGGSAKNFECFYQAQCLWDEGMAETLSDFLRSSEGQGRTVLVLVGNGHVAFDFGIPKRLHRRIAVPCETLVLKEWKKEIEEDLDFTFAKTTQPLADFVWVARSNSSSAGRPRIGVILEKDLAGLRIERVIPGSPAERAGMLPGDRLIAVDQKKIEAVPEIHEALEQKGWGKTIPFTILREGLKKEVIVTLPPAPD